MPQYSFFCKGCSLQFKRRLSVGSHPTHTCPSCDKGAPRQWEGQGFGFEFAQTAATAQANSGVTKHDYPTADQVVGRSADAQWQLIHSRNAAKDKIRDRGVALARRDAVTNGQAVTEYTTLNQGSFDARKRLEGRFKTKAAADGIEAPSKSMPAKKVEAPR